MIMFGSFLPSLSWLAPPKFTRAWEPTLLWNHYTHDRVLSVIACFRQLCMNQLHVLALNEGVRRKKALWRPAGEPNCSRWCWRGGPADVGKTCWSYWIN